MRGGGESGNAGRITGVERGMEGKRGGVGREREEGSSGAVMGLLAHRYGGTHRVSSHLCAALRLGRSAASGTEPW